jgi:hypothetical protein
MTESRPDLDLPDDGTADEHQTTAFVPFSVQTTKPLNRSVEDKCPTRATSAEDALRGSGFTDGGESEDQNHQRISGRMSAAALTTAQLVAVDLYLRDLDEGR